MLNKSVFKKVLLLLASFNFFLSYRIYAELPELLPREYFFAKGSRTFGFQISPDGKQLAYLKELKGGKRYLYIKTVGKAEEEIVLDKAEDIWELNWAFDNKHLLYLNDKNGDENFHVYAIDTEKKEQQDLTPFEGVKAQNLLIQRTRPDEILAGLNIRDKHVFDIYRISLKTYEVTKVEENPGDVRWWLADNDLEVRAAVAINPENAATTLRVRSEVEEPWRDLIVWPFGETGLLEGYGSEIAIAFTEEGNGLYVQAAFGSNTTRIARVDIETGSVIEIVASDPEACIWNEADITLYSRPKILFHPLSMKVQAVGFNYLIPEWRAVDDDIKEGFLILGETHKGVFDIVSRDEVDKKWIVEYYDDNTPGAYFLYDRSLKKAELLCPTMSHLNEKTFAEMRPIIIKARDGMKIPCYLTLPRGVPPRNLPLVMNIHGGPWARDEWGYSGIVQWLANRGYAVLQVNFRGSAGFGKEFLNAGIGQVGVGSMQHDITDAAKWAIDEGIADPKRIAIRGVSYGGYATLAGLAFTPDLYACGIDEVGMSNLKTLIESFPEWWAPITRRWILRLGNVLEDEALNEKVSPYFHVDKIKGKLMIIHGVNDPRVGIDESNRIVEVLKQNGLDVIYLIYQGEGHGIVKYANFLDKLGRMEEFLAEHMGSRFQPWEKIEGCTVEVRTSNETEKDF